MRRLDLRKTQAAHLNTIRDINRQIVLNYVREREPISRAEIARETALQRSTISAIVESLTKEGLVEEVGEGESTGGRRPTLLRLRTKEAIAVGVAITPSCTTIATSDLAGRIVEQEEFPTNPDPDQTFGEVIALIRKLCLRNHGSIEAVGVSLPGLVDPATGNAVYVPYFKWRDLPIAKTIGEAVGLPVIIDNDANAVALAELWFGRPEVSDARDFIFVLVAEGVGTGIIFDGQVYRGQQGAAGEFLLGVILDQLSLSAEAEGAYHSALKLQPNSVPALLNLGVLLARTDRKDEAIERFEQVLRLDPHHAKAVFNLGALNAASGNYERAIPLLERAAGVTGGKINKQETTDPALLLTLVNAYAHAGQRDAALKLAIQLEQIAGDHAPTLFTLGLSLAEAHEYSAALRLFERTNVLRPQTYEVLYNLGLAFYNLNRLDEAAQAMSAAATLQPAAPDPYYRVGLITSAQGDTKSALEFFLKAIELRPDFAEANFMAGEELLRRKAEDKAISFYESAIAQHPSKQLYHLRLGVAFFRLQRYERAHEIFSRALERFPDNTNFLFLLGYAARAQSRYDEAVAAFNRALELQPNNPDVMASLGYIASQRG